MDTSWIKLYRKARDNDIMRDPVAWTLFCYILMTVHRDTGSMKTGRIYLSAILKIDQSTIYKALKRLSQKYNLIDTLVTTKYTEIIVSKWSIYQNTDNNGNNKVTTKEQQSNTIQEERSKKNTNISEIELQEIADKYEIPLVKVKSKYDDMVTWLEEVPTRKKGRNYKATLMNWLRKDKKETKPSIKIFKGVI